MKKYWCSLLLFSFCVSFSAISCRKNEEEIIKEYENKIKESISDNHWSLSKAIIDSSKIDKDFNLIREMYFNADANSYFIFDNGSIEKGYKYKKVNDLMVYIDKSYSAISGIKEGEIDEEVKLNFRVSNDTLMYGNKYGKYYFVKYK